MRSGLLCRSCAEVESECLCSFWIKLGRSRMEGIKREVIETDDGPRELVWAEMKAWKSAGLPVVGHWTHVGDLNLGEEGQLDWVAFKEKGIEPIPLSGLGNYVTVQVPGCGYKELVHRQLWQDLSGTALPKGVEVHHRNHQYSDNRLVNLQALPTQFHRRMHR